jgi:hypothetical protein
MRHEGEIGVTVMNEIMRDERLQIMLSVAELQVVDDFRFKQRMPSRAAAVRELMKRGLAAEGYNVARPGSKSTDYGVTGSSLTRNDDSESN